MGIFSRMKNVVKSKANDTVDKARNPEKELDLVITELDEIRKSAIQELLGYKTTAKQMERDIERNEARALEWEKRAMTAVKAGDDELAKTALREQKLCRAELAKLRTDRDQAAAYAVQLNNSRKEADTKLRLLKLRRGSLATQMKAARTGSALGFDNALFDKLDETEARIDDAAFHAEAVASLDAELEGGSMSEDEFDRKLLAAGGAPDAPAHSDEDDPLAALKAKMSAASQRKKLGE